LALEKGAHDIFAKPVDIDELKVVLQRVQRRVEMEKASLEERHLAQQLSFETIIGSSAVMKTVFSTITKVASANVPVLILGESGPGKKLVANAIHNASARKDFPFVPINCGAIPDALLESELFG